MNIGLMGHGVVGSGVAEILLNNADAVSRHAGREARLARVLDLREFDVPYAHLFTKESAQVTAASDIDIVVECMGGVEPAFSFLADALRHGKHCVTSNKELVVEKGDLLTDLARENGVYFLYEASCGGGIPALHPMKFCLGANHIQSVYGILNGTTNYMLTRMKESGASYAEALREAQSLGYAEQDPTADVEGHDARRKTAILAHIGFGAKLSDDKLYPCRGISGIDYADIAFAREIGCDIKLLGSAHLGGDGKYTAYVGPHLVPGGHPLANVRDVFNAILVRGDMVGDVMFYGAGAGKLPTASAVVSDVIEIACGKTGMPIMPENSPAYDAGASRPLRYFLRVESGGESAKEALGGRIIEAKGQNGFALVTPEMLRAELDAKLDALAAQGVQLGERICVL